MYEHSRCTPVPLQSLFTQLLNLGIDVLLQLKHTHTHTHTEVISAHTNKIMQAPTSFKHWSMVRSLKLPAIT